MRKYIIVILFSILSISTIFFWFSYYTERTTFDLYKIKTKQESNQLKAVNEGIKGSFLKSQIYNNTEVSLPDREDFHDFTFYLFISENQCSSCVNATLKYYTSNISIIPDSNFIVLANFSPNALKHLKVEHQLKCRIVSTFRTNVTIAENKYPCFFIYDNNEAETEMFLFPLKNEPEMMKKYFENVRDRYFNQTSTNE